MNTLNEPVTGKAKNIPIKDFVEAALLDKVNLEFFLPMGLKLNLNIHNDKYTFDSITDLRQDKEALEVIKEVTLLHYTKKRSMYDKLKKLLRKDKIGL